MTPRGLSLLRRWFVVVTLVTATLAATGEAFAPPRFWVPKFLRSGRATERSSSGVLERTSRPAQSESRDPLSGAWVVSVV
jgi:hypothetical protein